ncbi:hypothetical protein MJ575_29315 [Klebsiella pneumoniae]|nr:hypothetical protein MJ575_29315 [Klebsiella pneumoniae]
MLWKLISTRTKELQHFEPVIRVRTHGVDTPTIRWITSSLWGPEYRRI